MLARSPATNAHGSKKRRARRSVPGTVAAALRAPRKRGKTAVRATKSSEAGGEAHRGNGDRRLGAWVRVVDRRRRRRQVLLVVLLVAGRPDLGGDRLVVAGAPDPGQHPAGASGIP